MNGVQHKYPTTKKDESLRNFHWCLIRTLHNYPFSTDWKSISVFLSRYKQEQDFFLAALDFIRNNLYFHSGFLFFFRRVESELFGEGRIISTRYYQNWNRDIEKRYVNSFEK